MISATFWRLPFEYVLDFLRGVELEPFDQVVSFRRVEVAAEPAEVVDDLAAGEVRPQADVAGHVGDAMVQLDGIEPGVAAEESDVAAVVAQQAEQRADGDRLAGPVGAEVAVHLAGAHLDVQPVERAGRLRTS